jgi:hypothetical protein
MLKYASNPNTSSSCVKSMGSYYASFGVMSPVKHFSSFARDLHVYCHHADLARMLTFWLRDASTSLTFNN